MSKNIWIINDVQTISIFQVIIHSINSNSGNKHFIPTLFTVLVRVIPLISSTGSNCICAVTFLLAFNLFTF